MIEIPIHAINNFFGGKSLNFVCGFDSGHG